MACKRRFGVGPAPLLSRCPVQGNRASPNSRCQGISRPFSTAFRNQLTQCVAHGSLTPNAFGASQKVWPAWNLRWNQPGYDSVLVRQLDLLARGDPTHNLGPLKRRLLCIGGLHFRRMPLPAPSCKHHVERRCPLPYVAVHENQPPRIVSHPAAGMVVFITYLPFATGASRSHREQHQSTHAGDERHRQAGRDRTA